MGKSLKQIIKLVMKIRPGWIEEKDIAVFYKNLPRGKITILEIGTGTGRSAICMAETNPEAEIYTVDNLTALSLGLGKEKPKYRQHLDRLFSNYPQIHFIEANCKLMKWNKTVDFLFIDGDHAYNSVKADFEKFGQSVKSGGLVAFHDYYVDSNKRKDIEVKKYLDDIKLPIKVDGSIALWRKP